ncbi:MAG TPA: preprotein translocase subunit SecE [Methyloradius sp.]
MINKIKLVVALLLVAAGIAGYYALADQALVLRILVVFAGIIAAFVLTWTTPLGKEGLGFIQDSVAEAKRVVWPSRKEAIQTTVAVFVLVIVMAIFLAIVDAGFLKMVQWIMGRSA